MTDYLQGQYDLIHKIARDSKKENNINNKTKIFINGYLIETKRQNIIEYFNDTIEKDKAVQFKNIKESTPILRDVEFLSRFYAKGIKYVVRSLGFNYQGL